MGQAGDATGTEKGHRVMEPFSSEERQLIIQLLLVQYYLKVPPDPRTTTALRKLGWPIAEGAPA